MAIDKALRPLSGEDPQHRKEVASTRKMLKGDACWVTHKRILGWDINLEALTLHLPPEHRLTRLRKVLSWLLPPHQRLPVRKWHQVLGKLRSMSPALPGNRGLFSVLQEAVRHTDKRRVRSAKRIHAVALDFLASVTSVHDRPTRLHKLVPTHPSDIGACDACQVGMGGIWFDNLDPRTPPFMWQQSFPVRVANALITSQNPHGSLSLLDFKLMGCLHTWTLSPLLVMFANAPSGLQLTIARRLRGLPGGPPHPWPPARSSCDTMPCTNVHTALSRVSITSPVP